MEAPKIYGTIATVMQKINAIAKGRKNQQQGFSYRGIDDVMNELHPIMAGCGLFVVPTVLNETRTEGKSSRGGSLYYTRLTIKFTFYASDGSNVEAVVIGEAMDSGDKASNKALSIGLKYAMLQVFCIPTEDEKDPDAQSPSFEGRQQPARQNPPRANPPRQNAPQQPAGGADTPEQHTEINNLLGAMYRNGAAIFSQEEIRKIGTWRMSKTADEVINYLKEQIAQRRTEQGNGPVPNQGNAEPKSFDEMGALF